MSSTEPDTESRATIGDRQQLGRILQQIGLVGVAGALVVGIIGWIAGGRAIESVQATLSPISRIVSNVSESIEASGVIFEQTTDAVEAIETATRSAVRTLTSVSAILDETSALAGRGIADSLDSAVDTLPGLISTAVVVDRTMQALSFVGVDYDQAAPLDEALTELRDSLAPIPDQVRGQVELMEALQADLDRIADDARGLSAVLLDTRIEMQEGERVLASAFANAAAAAERVDAIRTDLDTYASLARIAAVAATVALLAGTMAPLLLGVHMRRSTV